MQGGISLLRRPLPERVVPAVLGMGHLLHVGRIDAEPVRAEVVQGHTVSEGTVEVLIYRSMSSDSHVIDGDLAVPAAGRWPLPYPAAGLGVNVEAV